MRTHILNKPCVQKQLGIHAWRHRWAALAGVLGTLSLTLAQEPPTITRQPTNLNLSLGGTATFRVYVGGTTPFGFQWHYTNSGNAFPLDGLVNPSALKSILNLTNVQSADAGGYFVVVTNVAGSATSQVAQLIVDPTFVRMDIGAGATDMYIPYWVDLDGDKWLELVVVGGFWTSGGKPLMVFENNQDGTLSRNLTHDLSRLSLQSACVTWGDLDGDGDLDGFVGIHESQAPVYLRNNGGGHFTKVVADRGWTGNGIAPFGSTVACADSDNDGVPDLVVGYWGNSATGLWGTNSVLHGLGDGRFEVDRSSALALSHTWTEHWSWADWNADGRLDLYGATSGNAGELDLMFENLGDGQFLRITNCPLVKIADLSINAAWGDYDNDGDLDVLVTSWSQPNQLYRNQGNGVFEPDPASPSFPALASGLNRTIAVWGDYDNDGWLDLFVAHLGTQSRMFHNRGDGTFEEVTTGSPVAECQGSGAAWADYDNDGYLDLSVVNGNQGFNYLYRNNLRQVGNTNGWLKVKLVGKASNRDGIGTTIRIKATIGGHELWQMRQIVCQSYASELLAHFGLGDATNVDLVRIEWPSGNVTEIVDQAPDQLLTVTESRYITPARPSASLNGSVTLTRSTVSGATYQWQCNGVALLDQTNRILNLTNVVVEQEGRYSVVVSNATTHVTNYVYLHVDTQFTKINEGPLVTDEGSSGYGSWADYDGDGYPDLSVARYTLGTSALYHNNRDGTFSRLPDPSFMKLGDGFGSWGDWDNDSFMDLMIWRANATLTCFGDGHGACELVSFGLNTPTWWACAMADYDRDGRIDLYFSRVNTSMNRLYRNEGDRTFKLMAFKDVGQVASANTWGGPCWGDMDDDGWPDLYLPSNQGSQSLMFRNEGNGHFASVANLVTRTSTSAIAGAWGDYDNDGRLDLCVASFNGTTAVYRNLGNAEFERTAGTPVLSGTYNFAAWADYDNDGWLDLFISGYMGATNKLFHNNADGSFTAVSLGSIVNERPRNNAGTYTGLWFDYDNDGALDLYVLNGDDNASIQTANQLYHNNGNTNAWLTVRLIGTSSNRDAVGAKVRVLATYAGKRHWQRRDISAGDAYNGNHRYAHFGLGNATKVTTLRVEWPSGTVEEFTNLTVNQMLTLVEPSLRGEFGVDGMFYLQIKGDPNRTYEVQASADLTTWESVLYVVGPGADQAVEIAEPVSEQSQRFYRMVVVQ